MRSLKIGIWGLGLIGGSLAKALRRRPEGLAAQGLSLAKLTVFNRSAEGVALALAEGVIDGYCAGEPWNTFGVLRRGV